MSGYLVKSEGPDRVGGQLHCVQQSDLDEAVGLCAPCWPVLITLHLQGEEGRSCERCKAVCMYISNHFCERREKERADLGECARVQRQKRRRVLKQIWESFFVQNSDSNVRKKCACSDNPACESGFSKCVGWRVTKRERVLLSVVLSCISCALNTIHCVAWKWYLKFSPHIFDAVYRSTFQLHKSLRNYTRLTKSQHPWTP